MTAAARAASKLTIDNPDADGQISEWGIGADWPAAEPRLQKLDWTPDLSGAYGWIYGEDCEYIEKLNAIGLVGTVSLAAMDLDQWTVNTGLWRESPSAGHLRVKWLQYYDGRPDRLTADRGSITSNGSYSQNLLVWIWRMPQAEDDTDPTLVDITFEGNGVVPRYTVRIPGAQNAGGMIDGDTRTHYYPTLYGKTTSASTWTVIDEHRGSGMGGYRTGQEALLQVVRIEYVDGWMLVRMADSEDLWAYRGEWTDSNGREVQFGPSAGPITIEVCGHPCFVNVQQLAYAAEATITPQYALSVPGWVNDTPSYREITYEPNVSGTVTVAAEELATRASRPQVTFASDTINRPLLYRVQEYRAATIGAANSSEVTTDSNAQLELLSITGRCDEDWRGATIEATIEAQRGSTLADIAYNSKIAAAVTIDNGDNWYTQFTGYALSPSHLRADPTARRVLTLQAADGVQARLGHKQMMWHCSYEAWPVDDAFEHILNRAGVAAALISVDADVSLAEMGSQYYLPQSDPRGGELLAFRPDEGVVSALDKISVIRDLEWGVGSDGVYFLRPRTVHVAGAYDWTLDEDTSTDEDVVVSVQAATDYDDFCNMLFVLVGAGTSSAAHLLTDFPSINDDTAANYIGEDRWQIHVEPDGDDAVALAKRLWAKRETLAQTVYWTTHYHPDLMPGDEVRVQVARSGIADGTIFRIVAKTWAVDADGQFSQTFEGVVVEEG